MDRMAHDLQPDDAARFRAAMQARMPEIEAARARMEQARAAMSRAIAQSPYDEVAGRSGTASVYRTVTVPVARRRPTTPVMGSRA